MNPPVDISGHASAAFDRGTSPILQMISIDQAKQISQYQGDDALKRRIEELATKSNDGVLSADEQAEYEGYVRANKFIAILQAQARKFLASAGGHE